MFLQKTAVLQLHNNEPARIEKLCFFKLSPNNQGSKVPRNKMCQPSNNGFTGNQGYHYTTGNQSCHYTTGYQSCHYTTGNQGCHYTTGNRLAPPDNVRVASRIIDASLYVNAEICTTIFKFSITTRH